MSGIDIEIKEITDIEINDILGKKKDKKKKKGKEKEEKIINGWGKINDEITEKFMLKLKYNQTINSFFYFKLKSKENFFSWCIIVLSTFTSSLTLLTNLENEPFTHFFLSIQIALGLFSIIITLIAAWMKKQQFVERINLIDRYVQKITRLIEELDVHLILMPTDRLSYDDFKKKYHPQITEYLSTSPSISPKEWKNTVYTITRYYPEIISQDGVKTNKLWPWYRWEKGKDKKIIRDVTHFGENIMKTYHSQKCCSCFYRKFTLEYLDDDEDINNKNKGKEGEGFISEEESFY